MACGQILRPPGMDDRFGPHQQPYQHPAFFPQAQPNPLARPPLPPPRRFAQGAPAKQYNSAPPTRPGGKRKRGGKNKPRNRQNQRPRPAPGAGKLASRRAGVTKRRYAAPCPRCDPWRETHESPHYAERAETPMTLPLTAPHAPYNNNSFLKMPRFLRQPTSQAIQTHRMPIGN